MRPERSGVEMPGIGLSGCSSFMAAIESDSKDHKEKD